MFVDMFLARGAEELRISQDSQLHCHHRSWTKVTEWQPKKGSHLDQNSPSSYSFGSFGKEQLFSVELEPAFLISSRTFSKAQLLSWFKYLNLSLTFAQTIPEAALEEN